MADAIAELPVAEASGEIASIFNEIAEFSGVPMPALIWRHLATLPGVLPEAWGALRPLYVTGRVQSAAWRAASAAIAGHASGVSRSALDAAGVDAVTAMAYERVLASYNRANPVNFVGVCLLRTAMRAQIPGPAESVPASQWQPPEPIHGVPPMMPVSAIGQTERSLIAAIAVDPAVDRRRIVPSLYRHLTSRPALVRLLHDDLVPRIRSGELPDLWRRAAAALEGESLGLARFVPALPALGRFAGLSETVDRFAGLIPEMVAIGGLLRNGLDRAD
ncbi:MAG: hypothetical protein SFW09_22220 [Hyphomicrobiaceae bacterium]|nr:hypothetical protein [Hyphomicrobiaceae bacterium]